MSFLVYLHSEDISCRLISGSCHSLHIYIYDDVSAKSCRQGMALDIGYRYRLESVLVPLELYDNLRLTWAILTPEYVCVLSGFSLYYYSCHLKITSLTYGFHLFLASINVATPRAFLRFIKSKYFKYPVDLC